MNFNFFIDFMYLATIYGMIVSVTIFLFSPKYSYSKRLLGTSLFAYSWFCLLGVLLYSHAILKFPHLFRTAAPLMYLIAPTSYLYVRTTINGETRPRKNDWIHFIPFMFLSMELFPFYIKNAAYKIQAVNYYIFHKEDFNYLREGILEGHFHFIFMTILVLLYAYLQRNVIRNFLSTAPGKVKHQYENLFNWLNLYTVLLSITFIVILISCIFSLYLKVFSIVPNIIMSINLFAISLILVIRPRILYSSDDSIPVVTKEPDKPKPPLENGNKLSARKDSIDALLRNQRKYLIKGYSLADMAAELNIPQHMLSVIINQEYHMTFNNLVNKYRIEYVINSMDEQKMANYTFEGMAEDAGFNSRITFYRAFVKVTGQTPTAYLKKER